jgi:hypothetical protein
MLGFEDQHEGGRSIGRRFCSTGTGVAATTGLAPGGRTSRREELDDGK